MKSIIPSRQVHLDFHTSGDIPGIGADFDPKAFAKTFKDAYVNSVTVFARCHHGYIYYPSKTFPERVHPHLKCANLLREQVDALHEAGIRAPIYITVQWDRYTAERHPEWLIRKSDGSHEGGSFMEPGFYQSLCVNTGYWNLLKAQTLETIEYIDGKPDGFFFDITGIRPCLCHICRDLMKERSIDVTDNNAVRDFAAETMNRFKAEMSALVRAHTHDCTILYNAGHIGPSTVASADDYTHFEMESLPGEAAWGYMHFPISARYARTLKSDNLGMTGKFHTSWGDFHSLKNLAALEFECFRMLSYGVAASIGDQLEPRGTLNPATYNLIGKVYKQFAQREAWGRPGTALVDAALITPEPVNAEFHIPQSIMGAAQMLEELALQFDIVDTDADLSRYKLIILPDDLIACAGLQKRIDAYAANGGAVIACAQGGSDKNGMYPKCFGAATSGINKNFPDFIIANGPLAKGLEQDNEYVIYLQSPKIQPTSAATILKARAPYFPRKGDKFCSHRYTPSAKGSPYPTALQNGNVILFAHRMFEQYRQCAPQWCKLLISNAIDTLLPKRLVHHDGPSTMTVTLLNQPEQSRVSVHALSYIPVRKSATIDIIEEPTVLRDVRFEFNLPGKQIKSACLVPENIPLKPDNNTVIVPEINGYAIIELQV